MASEQDALDRLILPGTPEETRERYLTLAERARTRDFGLLEQDVIILDTETTGLSFRDCSLIMIAAARLRGRDVVDTYRTFVHPGKPIPPEIKRLTGIGDADVADAPTAEEAVRGLAEFTGGDATVIAHNASFDRTFVEGVPGGHGVASAWVDSLALSRIALPRLSSHRLADMATAFGCADVSHRADDDVAALCGMWRIILCGLADLPQGLVGMLADMHPDVAWAYRPILSQIALEQRGSTFSLRDVRHELVASQQDPQRNDPAEVPPPFKVPTRAEIEEAFAPGGIVSRMYPGYEPRPEQVAMAEEVRSALATSSHRAIEAGTGVGKSVAYLLPEVLFAQANGVTIGVATKTNALTDQLMTHELPALDQALPQGVRFRSLKGYDHYPCLRRLEHAATGELPSAGMVDGRRTKSAVEQDMLTAIATIYAYVAQSPTGDLDALGIRWRSVPRSMLTCSSAECLRSKCPFFSEGCMVHGARRLAASADVVVTNHSLLLRNVIADGKILPPIRHWVVDEAHSLEQEARRQWAVTVSAEDSRAVFEQLGGARSGAIHAAGAALAGSEASTVAAGLIAKAAAVVPRASLAMGELFDAVRGLSAVAGRGGGYDSITLWIGDDVRSTPEWASVQQAASVAAERLEETCKALDEAQQKVVETVASPPQDLVDPLRALRELFGGVRLFATLDDASYVYSAVLSRNSNRAGSEQLVAEKLDVGQELAQRWLPETMSVVFTSATIAVGEDFAHFDHVVGLDALESTTHRDVRLDSSYDYDGHMQVVVAKGLPEPNDPRYLEALEDLLLDVHVAMDGSVLTLFTNRREMERVYEGLRPRLSEHGLDLAVQERGSATWQVRNRFVSERSLSLFALKSFWEGFDAVGDTLRCVVIPKLPFASPNDPIVRERDAREKGAWRRYSLPEAVLTMKQAAGRLIRSSSDQGILVLCDSRITSKGYGRAFVESLPSKNQIEMDPANMERFIRTWRSSHE